MEKSMKRALRKLNCASQAEILRARQRDDDFIKYLRDQLYDILQNLRKHRILYTFQSDIPATLIYFLFTTAMGNQTLGEEYTGIVEVNLKTRKVPSLTARLSSVILECFGQRVLLKLLGRLQESVSDPRNKLTPSAIIFLINFLSFLRSTIPIFILMHKGLFYTYGRYYSIGKRIAKIDYAKVYGTHSGDVVSWGFKLLGIATLVQCALRLWQNGPVQESNNKHIIDDARADRTCQLCLETVSTTATPCGHLFCWRCLCDWLRTKNQCPLCREYVAPSRVVHLMNL